MRIFEEAERAMLESKLFDLRYDMDCIGENELETEIENMTDCELLKALAEIAE